MSTDTLSKSAARLVGLDLARACAAQADQKLANNITILDLRGISQLADFFVICCGTSLPHLKAIRDEVVKGLTDTHGERPNNRDGLAESQWMVLDYIDVVVHIFHEDKRSIYSLEELWGDAPRLDWKTGEEVKDTATTTEANELERESESSAS